MRRAHPIWTRSASAWTLTAFGLHKSLPFREKGRSEAGLGGWRAGYAQDKGQTMRFFSALSAFGFTIILGLIAFTYTAINFSATMRDLLISVQHVRDQVQQLSLPDDYIVWMDIFLQPNLIVFVGFSVLMRLLLGIVSWIFGPGPGAPIISQPSASSSSPFGRWG
jgi:hypothetical protein